MATTRDEELLGKDFRKIHPKLRMVAKALDPVNERRSEQFASMSASPPQARIERELLDLDQRVPGQVAEKLLTTEKVKEVSSTIEVNTFVTFFDDSKNDSGHRIEARTIKLKELRNLTEEENVAYVELGEPLKHPDSVASGARVSPPSLSERNIPGRDSGGRDVLIGIIDVGGFDFSHPDFIQRKDGETTTRWVRIWDQRGGLRPTPDGFTYGSEIRQEHMNAALNSEVSLPAWALEPQSQMATGSHGTHVASIAAGNRGVCRNARLAGVLIDLPDEFVGDRRNSFYDSTRVAEAISYLCRLAEELECEVSINVSLGTNGGAHDASNAANRWIDHELSTPGRIVCIAAGNAGQESPSGPGDIGFALGRIHTSGVIPARGLTKDIEWIVVGNGLADVSENELELWYGGADRFAVSVTPPGLPTIGPVAPGEYVQNHKLEGGSMLSIYNEVYHPANGANYIAIYLSPFLKKENPIVGVPPGKWRVQLHGLEVRDGRFNGWIERDDPRPRGIVGSQEYWNFPSFFAISSNVDSNSVSSLACGHRIISVANFDSANRKINVSSSQGPTRDNRQKPDVAAPGTDIVAANGFFGDGDSPWIAMTGTSMASPYVAGVAGLMLEAEPKLTSAQITGIIQRTSQPLSGATFEWANDAGFGVLNPEACVEEARSMNKRVKIEPKNAGGDS
ncbi:MAG: S8 family serine peptidase [Verrucomicrobiota bacterium]